MELTVKRVFVSVALCINKYTVVGDDSVCNFVFDMYIVHSNILSINVKNVTSYFPSTPTVCLNANSVGDGVEQATLWKDEEVR